MSEPRRILTADEADELEALIREANVAAYMNGITAMTGSDQDRQQTRTADDRTRNAVLDWIRDHTVPQTHEEFLARMARRRQAQA